MRDVPPRILIIRTDRIGDVVLSTPVIRSLRRVFPDATLGMMVDPRCRELVEGHPDLNAVFLYDKEGPEKSWAGTLRFSRKLKEHRFDTAIILHSTRRVVLTAWLAGIRRRVGYSRRMGRLLTQRIPYIKGEGNRHELEYNLDLLREIGVNPESRELFVPTTPAQEEKVGRFLTGAGLNGAAWIALHPGASCPSKRWLPDRFAAVADALAQRHGTKTVVVAGPDGIEQGREVIRRMRSPAVSAMDLFTLGELVCLFRKARCLISNDSGPVHLACAAKTPVVSIFGRWGGGLSPRRWGPTGPRSVSIHRDIGCRPCLAHRCTIGFACLKAVHVEEVFSAAEYVANLSEK